jgi:putative DNA primase/helicase
MNSSKERGQENGKQETPTLKLVAGQTRPPKKRRINAALQDLPTLSKLAWDALTAANKPPTLFQFGGVVARVQRESTGSLVLKRLTLPEFRYHLARAAVWHQKNQPSRPPDVVCQDMLARPELPLPVITRIVEAPVYGRDGTLVTDCGYHPRALTYFDKSARLQLDPVPQHPSASDVKRARDLIIDDLLVDFPFVTASDSAHVIALLLLPFVRNLIDGPTPLHLIESPIPGSGKGLIATVALIPAVGRNVMMIPPTTFGEEMRKRITAALSQGPSVILFDNFRTVDSPELAAALTAPAWTDRILGRSEMVTLPTQCTWVCTANNPVLSTEIARRSIRIRIDPAVERPWQRERFKHTDLASWAIDHRAELVWAVLVIVNEWLASERRAAKCKRLGSFEQWSNVIGGILETVGITGFLENQELLYEATDAEGATFKLFVEAWWEEFEEQQVSMDQLFPVAQSMDAFELHGRSEQAQRVSLGRQIASHRDRIFGDWRVTSAGKRNRAMLWRLTRI